MPASWELGSESAFGHGERPRRVSHRGVRLTAILLATLAAPAAAQVDVSDHDLFRLYTGCSGVDLLVEVQIDDSTLELAEADVARAARSRLRAARIYDPEASPYLYVSVHVVGPAYAIDVELRQIVERTGEAWDGWFHSGQRGIAGTWHTASTGTSGNSGFILQGLSRKMDEFVDEYLRVNTQETFVRMESDRLILLVTDSAWARYGAGRRDTVELSAAMDSVDVIAARARQYLPSHEFPRCWDR